MLHTDEDKIQNSKSQSYWQLLNSRKNGNHSRRDAYQNRIKDKEHSTSYKINISCKSAGKAKLFIALN